MPLWRCRLSSDVLSKGSTCFLRRKIFPKGETGVWFVLCLLLEESSGTFVSHLWKCKRTIYWLDLKNFETDFMTRQVTVCGLSHSNWEKQESRVGDYCPSAWALQPSLDGCAPCFSAVIWLAAVLWDY